MTIANRAQARDEISGLFKTAWAADNAFSLFYDDVVPNAPGAATTQPNPYARLTIRHDDGDQVAFSDSSTKRYTYVGTVTVQIFTAQGTGLTQADHLVKVALDAFRGKRTSGGVLFMNVRSREIGPSGAYYQNNVLATFAYDEFA